MEGLLMASTRAHNVRAGARFIAMSVRAPSNKEMPLRPRLATPNEPSLHRAGAKKGPAAAGPRVDPIRSTDLLAALRIAPLIGRPVRRTVLSGARIILGGGLLHLLAALARGRRLLGALVGTLVLIGRRLRAGAALAARRRLVVLAFLASAHVLVGGRLRAGATLAAGRGLVRTLIALPGRARHAERGHGAAVDLPTGLKALLTLERHQRSPGARTEPAIGFADVEPLLDQHRLHMTDLVRSEIDRTRAAANSAVTVFKSPASTGRTHRHDRHDVAAVVDDHDVVTHDEVLVPAILREVFD